MKKNVKFSRNPGKIPGKIRDHNGIIRKFLSMKSNIKNYVSQGESLPVRKNV